MEPIIALILKIHPNTLKKLYMYVPSFKVELSLKSVLTSLCMEYNIITKVNDYPSFWYHYMIKWHPESKIVPIEEMISVAVYNDDYMAINNILRATRWRVNVQNVAEYVINNKINILNNICNATNPDYKISFMGIESAIRDSVMKGNIKAVYACMTFINNNYSSHFDRTSEILKYNCAGNILYDFRKAIFATNFEFKQKEEIIINAPDIFGVFAYDEFILHLAHNDQADFIKWLYQSNKVNINQIRDTYCLCIDKIDIVEFYITQDIATPKEIANSFRNTSIINFDFRKALKVLKFLNNKGEYTKDLVERISAMHFDLQ
jgi:hypothetical protein